MIPSFPSPSIIKTKINHDQEIIMTDYTSLKYKVEAKCIKLSHFHENIKQKLPSSPSKYK